MQDYKIDVNANLWTLVKEAFASFYINMLARLSRVGYTCYNNQHV